MTTFNIPQESIFYSLILWHGYSPEKAEEQVLALTKEEVVRVSKGSIALAKEIFERVFLKREIPHEIFYDIKSSHREYYKNLGEKVFSSYDEDTFGDMVVLCLEEIHNRWVADNSAKYSRGDDKLFQHLPLAFIGEKEMAKDLLFLQALAKAFSFSLGEYGDTDTPFIPSDLIKEAYARYVERYVKKYDICSFDQLCLHINDISSFYPYLLMGEKGRERKEYMTSPEKVLILANSILSLNPIFTNL